MQLVFTQLKMTLASELIEDAYKKISEGNYDDAITKLSTILKRNEKTDTDNSSANQFNARYGLAICYFMRFMHSQNESENLNDSIINAGIANSIFENHFDIHLILGQSYAAKFRIAGDAHYRTEAFSEYQKAKDLAGERPAFDKSDIEKKIDVLIEELLN